MSRWWAFGVPLLLVAATVVAYLPSLSGDWVYDDHRFVAVNPAVEDGVPLLRYFSDPATQAADNSYLGLYRPLRTLSFRLVRVIGPGPGPQRIANLALHLLNGLLVLGLLRRLLPGGGHAGPAAGAALFLLHPLATESVAWVSSRGDLMALAGMLGALLLHLRGGRASLYGAPAVLALALLCKESAAVLPVLLLLVDAFRRETRGNLGRYVLHGAVVAAYLGVRYAVLGGEEFGQEGGQGLPPAELAGALLTGFALYVRDLLVPVRLAFEARPGAPALMVVAGAVLLIGLLVTAVAARKRGRWLSLACLWFLVALLPVTVLQFLYPLKITVANRFAYPAIVAGAIVLGRLAAIGPRTLVAAAIVPAALLALTMDRAGVWEDDRALWESVIAAEPEHMAALFGLGRSDVLDGDLERATEQFTRVRLMDPAVRFPTVRFHLGRALGMLADRRTPRSPERQALRLESFRAYDEALKAWNAGAAEGRHLFRETALYAAHMAAAAGLPLRAAEHARSVTTDDGRLPPDREWTLEVLRGLSLYLREGEPELSRALASLIERLETEGWE